MIKSNVIAHSINQKGDELISIQCVCDSSTANKIVLEHKDLSVTFTDINKVEFQDLVKQVQNNPFIPIAWQKDNKATQESEYMQTKEGIYVCETGWLEARNSAIKHATWINSCNLTKELCNKLLEPFMWTTMLITGSREGWDNFFYLRNPVYEYKGESFNSKKDLIKSYTFEKGFEEDKKYLESLTNLDWLQINKGQAEIHMMILSEKIYDAINESKPEQLSENMWHIPFMSIIDSSKLKSIKGIDITKEMIKISTAMAARTSYIVVGEEKEILKSSEDWQKLYPEIKVLDPDGWDRKNFENSWNELISFKEYNNRIMYSTCKGIMNHPLIDRHSTTVKEIDYEKMIELHDKLISQNSLNSNFLEHCARAMSDIEYIEFIKGKCYNTFKSQGPEGATYQIPKISEGWCNAFKGFIPYRYMIDNKLKI